MLKKIINYKQDLIYTKFAKTKALSESSAKTLDELDLTPDPLFEKLLSSRVIIKINDRYYLDESNAAERFYKRSIIMLLATFGFTMALIGLLFLFT